MRPGESRNSQAISFAAFLTDERLMLSDDMRARVAQLKVLLAADHVQKRTPRAEKMLIVSTPRGPQGQTVVYFNLSHADQTRTAKRLLKRYFEHFGDHICKRADSSVHMLDIRDEQHLK